jgi:hypothetical protein
MKRLVGFIAAMAVAAACVVWADEGKKSDEGTLQGKIGRAHCSYGVAKSCAVSFKTADGKIYTLTKADKDLMEARQSDATLKVTGVVSEKDGKYFVDASKTEVIK